MSSQARRSSLLNIDNWLDKCTNDEPDSMIYEPDFANEMATMRAKPKQSELEAVYRLLTDTCTKIGLPPETVDERLSELDECLTSFFTTIQKDVEDEYEKLCVYKQELLQQVQKMMGDLYLPPFVPDENITLLQHCKRLKTKFNELNVVKQKRIARLQELRERQVRHCLVLGIRAPEIKTQTDIPTEEELVKLSNAVSDLEKEERRRKEKYMLLKDMILKCMEQVEYEPANDSERNILTVAPDYSESFLLQMSELHSKLEAKYAANQEKYEKLKARLESLFDRLDIDLEERRKFFEEHPICKPSLMKVMELEIERYEELKRQNIGKFIEKIKEELLVEYERCYIPEEEQDNFFQLDTVSEELLELYERELERIKKYYQDNKDIFEKFNKWREMWKELIDLEMKASDPNRFNNRGGQLLLEERKRKNLQKNLPKLEKDLVALNEKFEQDNGNKFRVFGTNMDEFISGCWDELSTAKEEEKRIRQRAKNEPAQTKGRKPGQPQQNTLPKKTPTKRGPSSGITATPSKVQCQRSVLGTPANSVNRLNVLTGMSGSVKKTVTGSTTKPPMSRNGVNSNTRSNIPVSSAHSGQVKQKDKTMSNSHGTDSSALSVSEQEFEDMIAYCPASARKRANLQGNR